MILAAFSSAWLGVTLVGLATAIWAVVAVIWSLRHGSFRDMRGQSRAIFDAVEAEGTPTDFYPKKGPPPSEYLL